MVAGLGSSISRHDDGLLARFLQNVALLPHEVVHHRHAWHKSILHSLDTLNLCPTIR